MVAELNIRLPRPITSFHQIELTSACNLRCSYCIHPHMPRVKMHMTWGVFERALQHVHYHVNIALDQTELNLCGVGESTLHPDFVQLVKRAREVVGPRVFLNFTTNGLLLDEELANALVPYLSSHSGHKPGVFVSLHRPEKAKHAVDWARKYGLLAGVSNDPALATINWAEQVKGYEVTAPKDRPCPWIREGRAFVFSDGDVGTCCLPATKTGVIGTVYDVPGSLMTKPYDLCGTCDQKIGVKGYDQYSKRLPTVGG